MKRRIDKKRHRQHLTDTLREISISYVWRPRLVDEGGNSVVVDAATAEDLPEWLLEILRRWQLKYVARIVPHEQTVGWKGYEDSIMFEVAAQRYPAVRDWSANNPETIHPVGSRHRIGAGGFLVTPPHIVI